MLSVSPAKVEATESCRRGIEGGLYLVVRRARLRVAEDSGVLPEVSGGGERLEPQGASEGEGPLCNGRRPSDEGRITTRCS